MTSGPSRWTPSLSSTVPSAKTWRNMQNCLPSSDRPMEIRLTSGSASVAARLTRGCGTIRPPAPPDAGADERPIDAPGAAGRVVGEGEGRGPYGNASAGWLDFVSVLPDPPLD